MFARMHARFRWLRRLVSRSEWSMRLLRLSFHDDAGAKPGLVMIQVDGLSYDRLHAALDDERLPFLRQLRDRESYRLQPMYSGLPSSTPAVQAEVLYGIPMAVPAFSYYDGDGEHRKMMNLEAAQQVEDRLEEQCEHPLLRGGSSYSNIYRGGAEDAHFCASTAGTGFWKSHRGGPVRRFLLLLLHIHVPVRIALLASVELIIALRDFLKGQVAGQPLKAELKFVPTRAAICIILREVASHAARLDITRGLPIVHLNLLGYDEQAHRRGPDSRFAWWTLKGIDNVIRKIWRHAHHANRRDYQVWIYTDHGQEDVQSYTRATGHDLCEVLRELLDAEEHPPDPTYNLGIANLRGRWLHGHRAETKPEVNTFRLAAQGPMAHVYLQEPRSVDDLDAIASRLADEYQVPLVMLRDGDAARVWTVSGAHRLPDDADAVLGPDHPFKEAVASDLVKMAHHEHAGDIILGGWCHGVDPISFPEEGGAHGGPAANETRGSMLLPPNVTIDAGDGGPVRAKDLYRKALTAVHPDVQTSHAQLRQSATRSLRLMTYNTHGCRGLDGRIAPERIARVIAQANPDIVCLQEVDVCRSRSRCEDQAEIIARCLDMEHHFHAAMVMEDEQYGNAIISRFPLRKIRQAALPQPPRLEPRGVLWVEADVDGLPLQVLATHLGLRKAERRQQVQMLLSDEWLGEAAKRGPVCLCGDFNLDPRGKLYPLLSRRLHDVQKLAENHRTKSTFASTIPLLCLDHIFLSEPMGIREVRVPRNRLARISSDHLPLVADIELPDDDD